MYKVQDLLLVKDQGIVEMLDLTPETFPVERES